MAIIYSFLVYIYTMETKAFNESIKLAKNRESIISSALARYFNASLCFIQDDERRSNYDFCLYSPLDGWASKVEMQDDYYAKDIDSTLCIELHTLDAKKKKLGKLYYTKADKLLFVFNKFKKVLLLDVKILKNLIINLEENGLLKLHQPEDFQAWKSRHDSLPTSCAIIPIQECILADPKACVISFEKLNITDLYENLQFRRQNYN